MKVAHSLLSKNLAYKCFHDQNDQKNANITKRKFKSEWRNISSSKHPKNKPFSIRLKVPENGVSFINDQIQGKVEVNFTEIDDYIILRSDGTPTFLLSSVVDDYEMGVTDIIRGDDHLTNSFRQKVIFDFLEYKPNFSHISLIHNERNQKLSKRDNAPSILEYREKGYLSKAINNYLLRLGWSYGNEEIFYLSEVEKIFTLKNIGKSASMHDKNKLDYLNNYHIKETDAKSLLELMEKKENFLTLKENLKDRIIPLINLFKDRAGNLCDIINKIKQFNINLKNYNNITEDLNILSENKTLIIKNFENINIWNYESIEKKIKQTISELNIGFKDFAQPIRILIMTEKNGPSITSLINIVGRDNFIRMIKDL